MVTVESFNNIHISFKLAHFCYLCFKKYYSTWKFILRTPCHTVNHDTLTLDLTLSSKPLFQERVHNGIE